jgi:hypothetical protein
VTSPRTPRQWAEDDTIPADVTAVHHHHEPLLYGCGTQCAWIRRASDWKGPWGYALEEAEMLRRMGPVTEVIEDAPLSEVLPETPEPPREDGPRSDAPTLWRRLQVAARVIKAFKPEDPSPELVAFLRDIRDAVDGDLLQDELSGDLMRFARGQGRLLTALLAAQSTEIAEDPTDDHSAERAAHADNWEAQP